VTDSSILDDLLLRWQEHRRHGRTPSVAELCVNHPAMQHKLNERIAAFESMEAMLGLGQKTHASPLSNGTPDSDSTVPAHLAEKLRAHGYELLSVIDQGGMGVVYKASQVELRRIVALKMIAGLRAGAKQAARFRIEAEAVARLHHPNIVQIYEVGVVDGHSFFSMEYVEGGTLAHRLARGALTPPVAVELVQTLARAIHHAHTRGVIHRDIKPGNVLLAHNKDSASGATLQPKIADFGLAKQLGSDSEHTATGEVLGTPGYMSPEQAEGKIDTLGPACDIYALGAILYESLTGRPPFKANSILETLRQVIDDDPIEPRKLNANIPRDVEAICLKCLEKKPENRYATAEALADDLRRAATGEPVTARQLTRTTRALRWLRRRPYVPALLLLLLGAAVAVAGRGYAERERKRTRATEVASQTRDILHRHCYECHGAEKAERKFFVLDRASLFDPNRKNVVPGKPEESRLLHRIEDGTMPPEDDDHWLPSVTEQELAIVKEWIAVGAPEFPPEPARNTPAPATPQTEIANAAHAVFLKHCYECHRVNENRAGIRILNYDLLVNKRKVVIPGKPDESEVYQLLITADESLVMPPKDNPRLTPAEIETVRLWIAAGAPPFPHQPKPKK
jgi:serine/threonine protein kinase